MDHSLAKRKTPPTSIKALYSVPGQLHWLINDVNDSKCASGTDCFYRPGQEALDSSGVTLNSDGTPVKIYQSYPRNSAGNGNSGNGAYVICIDN